MERHTTGAEAPSVRRAGPKRGLTTTIYLVAVSLYWVALYLYMPTLPLYAESKSDNLAVVGVVLSMYGLCQMIIRLPVGVASDWLGWRRPFIVIGFILAGIGAWTMGASPDIRGLIIGRAITGLAAGTWVPLVVAFSSLFPPEEAVRASALLTLVGSAGRILATGVTGSLNERGGYPLAFSLAAGAATLGAIAILGAREARRPPERPSAAGILRLISRRDVLLPSLLSAAIQYVNWASTFGFIPILASQLGATHGTQSLLLSINMGVVTLGNLVATTIVRRVDSRRLVLLSFTLLAAGVGGAALAPSLPFLFASQFSIGLGQGIVYPVLMGMSIRHVRDAERATAMGLHQSVYAAGMFGGPWLSGILADAVGIRPMFGVTALACLVSGLVGSRLLAGRGPREPSPGQKRL